MPQLDGLDKQREFVKNIVDHNLALVLVKVKQNAPALSMLNKTLAYFSTSKDLQYNNEKITMLNKCK